VGCVELIRVKVAEARDALLHEFDDERCHHQKMMSEYTRLQQRFDNLQGDMDLMTRTSSNDAHDRLPFVFEHTQFCLHSTTQYALTLHKLNSLHWLRSCFD